MELKKQHGCFRYLLSCGMLESSGVVLLFKKDGRGMNLPVNCLKFLMEKGGFFGRFFP